jgi:ABC-type branched-subunit amino acid transport system substrate-binding protein
MLVGRNWSRVAAMLAALCIVVGACSSDRAEDPNAEAGGGSTTTESAKPASDKFGTLDSPCGPGDSTGGTDQGVTADKVVIGYGDDAGFSVSPGLSHETSDAIKAMIKWCNDQGGINGRQIEGKYYDAAITNVVNAMTQACGEVFMLVGEAWALDSGQEETRLGCGLPAVPTYSVSPEFANAPLTYQAAPNPADIFAAGNSVQVAKLFPDEVKKASVMFGNFAATIDTKDKVLQAFPKFGWKFLNCPQEYAINGESDWKPFAQKLKDCGAEVVYYSGQAFPNMQNLLDDAAQLDYHPIWVTDSNNYLQSFADWNADGNGDNVYLRSAFVPFEAAKDGSATKQYMDIVKANGGDISQLGQQATSSFLLWATAAKQCEDLTRQCVLDELSKIKKWDGGGLHAETDPGDNMPAECSLLLKLDGTTWKQVVPEEPGEFECNPDAAFKLSGRVVDQAELDSNRVSTKFQP